MIRRLDESTQLETDYPYQRPQDPLVEVVIQTLDEEQTAPVSIRQRSLREKRKIFVCSVTAFMVGSLLILLSSPYRFEVLAPGGLSSPHSQILAAEGTDRCAACHAAASQSVGQWIGTTLWGSDPDQPTQSQLCMKCHENHINGQLALRPHNQSDDALAESTKRISKQDDALPVSFRWSAPTEHGNIECNACHREHHGKDENLAAMTDSQCQVCHSSPFRGFELDHPEFQNYGAKRRSRIAFDHNSHVLKHFPEANVEFNCNRCHIDDKTGNAKVLASFDVSCASCHAPSIDEDLQSGLTLLALPMLDMEAIEANQLHVGTWPLAATGDFDGPLPPLMRMLLSHDQELQPVLRRLPVNFDFSDIDADDPQSVADAVTLVWGIKRLIRELSIGGTAVLQQRLEAGLDIRTTKHQLALVSSQLNEYTFNQMVRRWLPNLPSEVQSAAVTRPETPSESSDQSLLAIRTDDKDSWWPNDERVLSLMVETLPPPPQQIDDDVLAINPLQALMKRNQKNSGTTNNTSTDPQTAHEPSPTMEQGKDVDSPVPNELETSLEHRPTPSITPTQPPQVHIEAPESTGWIRDDQTFRLVYRPSGHADSALTQWIDWVAASAKAPAHQDSSALFELMMATEGLGDCRRCHTADKSDLTQRPLLKTELTPEGQSMSVLLETRSLIVNWKGTYRDPTQKRFTKFSHAPHLTIPALQNCESCHEMKGETIDAKTFAGFDPSEGCSCFQPIVKSNCTNCHRRGGTPSGCTTCHHYHVGR
ncbi:MAG: cytochrome c3 family protein [Planctomycetota bacterium]